MCRLNLDFRVILGLVQESEDDPHSPPRPQSSDVEEGGPSTPKQIRVQRDLPSPANERHQEAHSENGEAVSAQPER